jgi:hypothetical protein
MKHNRRLRDQANLKEPLSSARLIAPVMPPKAFSSEVDAGSREENASKQKPRARF